MFLSQRQCDKIAFSVPYSHPILKVLITLRNTIIELAIAGHVKRQDSIFNIFLGVLKCSIVLCYHSEVVEKPPIPVKHNY